MSPLTEPTKLTLKQQSVAPLLLDTYSGAAAAYSLRNLSWAYGGPVVRVRRSSDNAEQDFTAAQVTDGTLTTFCGAGDGFVRTWYDQSGNGSHAIQTTSGSQPRVVTSGSVVLQGARPTLDFDGSSDYLDAVAVASANPKSIFVATILNAVGTTEATLFDSVASTQAIFYKAQPAGHYLSIGFGTAIESTTAANTSFCLYSVMHNGAASELRRNTAVVLTGINPGSNAFNGLRIASVRGTPAIYWNGKISEFIVYGSNQTTNRAAIESNINAYYAIY